ncbi:Thioredoxin reductase [uncultured delta proteobacterium]|uniref:Thioredoxin reductase n=1 Tax=uncultured delta proteobacterium TaxID=34034 RepID=A0A212K470_9DELT|nr:Thioredoxin reductase [uncultured delta proteobacterium]
MEHHELIILGAGPAGLTAAVYAQRSGLDAVVLEKGAVGGQITTTNDVENWPGFKQISGYDLAASLQEHAEYLGAEIRVADIQSLDFSEPRKVVQTDKGAMTADAIIICTGARHRQLGVPGEAELTGRGVSYCAVCDGPFFRNEEIVVVGGGDTAVEEAEYLTRFASKVYLVHRRDQLRAAEMLAKRTLANPKIEPVWDTVVTGINGKTGVESVSVKNVKTGAEKKIPVTGVFIFVGTLPNSEVFKGSGLGMDASGWVIADHATLRTNIEGVFAAGDVRETSLRQMITASADGARAAMSVYAYLSELALRK